MSNLRLNFACALYDRMQPLYTGEVRVQGVDLNFIVNESPRDTFDRMAGGLEFDACEFSSSEYISRFSANQCPLVAIPVFPSRMFRHGFICINRKSGIKTPKDLEGRRVGVPLYTMTAAVWIRGHLQHQYGVDLSKIHWVQGATNKPGTHGNPTVLPLVKQVPIEINRSAKSLSQMLEDGELDAILGADLPESLHTNPDIQRLFPNYHEVEREYYLQTKIFPVMHLVVIKRDVYEKNPFVATSLFEALNRSKDIALKKLHFMGALRYMLPWLTSDSDELNEVFGGDPWPYGVDANRPTLEALVAYLAEQSIIGKTIPIEDLFAPIHGLR